MVEARVLVVDDSAAMRALFSDSLEQAKNVTVVGIAADAAEAREQIAHLRPNVMTLDVEMPGMSGIDFLAEIMETKPFPVVMLSSLTQSGTETALRAYELGAVECFPKPLSATPEQFSKSVAQLGKIVLAAANSNLSARSPLKRHMKKRQVENNAFSWNGKILALTASMGGIDALSQLLASFPQNCPPTIIILHSELALVNTFIESLEKELSCKVAHAKDGASLCPGTIYIASDPNKHVIIEPGSPPCLRFVIRDAVDGFRPSATLLFGTIARSGLPSVGVVLTGMGSDGAKGLKMMRDAGCHTIVQDPLTAVVGEAPSAAIEMGAAEKIVSLDQLATDLIECCNRNVAHS